MSENPAPQPEAKAPEEDEDMAEVTRDFWNSMGMWGPVTIIVLVGFVIAYFFFVPPPPPKTFKIATGGKTGAYNAFAEKYKEILAKDGFTLEIVNTKGSIENLELLRKGEVKVAFVQGGTATEEDKFGKKDAEGNQQPSILASIGSLYYEPLWVFYDRKKGYKTLRDLKGARLGIGTVGSGTRPVAVQLLERNGCFTKEDQKNYQSIGSTECVKKLKAGELDAVFLVAGGRSKNVLALLEDKSIQLLDFKRNIAYERQFPFLSSVKFSEGMCDLKNNVPDQDLTLVAPTAAIVVRTDAHDALTPLILKAATEVHYPGDLFETPGAFPSEKEVDIPISADAKKYITRGPSILQRFLPFWLALALDRLKVMLVPLFTLLFPLVKIAPPIYRWRIRSKIFRWYRLLREIDNEVMSENFKNPEGLHKRLFELEKELDKVSVPLSYMEEFYNLRVHIALVDQFIEQRVNMLKKADQGAKAPDTESA